VTAVPTVAELLGRQLAATPDAVAAVCAGNTLTYRQLHAAADRVADALVAAGAGPEMVVALALPRSLGLVVALVGVLKAGTGYLPVDPRYPSDRLGFLLEDAAPTLVLTDSRTAGDLPLAGRAVLLMDDIERAAPHPVVRGRYPRARPDGLAYLMYTSGSSGRPKGVVITQETVASGVVALARVFGVAAGTTVLATTSINFDVSVFEFLAALGTGARVELVRDVLALGGVGVLARRRAAHCPIGVRRDPRPGRRCGRDRHGGLGRGGPAGETGHPVA